MAAVNVHLKSPGQAMSDAMRQARMLNRRLAELMNLVETGKKHPWGVSTPTVVRAAEGDLTHLCANMAVAFSALKTLTVRETRRSMAIQQLVGAVRDSPDVQG